ncbi:MAG: hypothetical protein KAV87_50140 [Desulfobacteraceae bacterium]|nr:hypothetical protein [Desulfobacteraceae bacterium]
MTERKGGREKGTRNKNSWKVLNELKKHNFDIIEEVLELYGWSKKIYTPLVATAMENLQNELPMTTGMADEDVNAMNAAGKSMGDILGKLMAYCYPKLTAMKIDPGSTDQINFSITIPTLKEEKKVKK